MVRGSVTFEPVKPPRRAMYAIAGHGILQMSTGGRPGPAQLDTYYCNEFWRHPMPAPRPYDASSRRESAARNRAAVLAACRELLFRDGYHRMTIRSVAGQAGVSPETIYKTFGGKPGLVKALWDVTLAGDDQPVAIADRPQMQEVQSAREPAEKLRRWAGFVRGANQRLASLYG